MKIRNSQSTIRNLAVVYSLVSSVSFAAPPPPAFAVAVVRRDGVLIPFGVYDGRRWKQPWPAPALELQIPINLQSVPKAWWGPTPALAEWQVWPASPGATPRIVHVTQPDWVDAHCVRQVGLRTDYSSESAVPPPTEQPYPKDGLAVAPPEPLLSIDVVPPGRERAAVAARGLRRWFNEAERAMELSFGHPISRRDREAVEPAIEALYAFGESPRFYYVEASRLYRKLGDASCTSIAFATGWMIDDGQTLERDDMVVDLLPCTKYGATYMLPLGAFRVGGRSYWVAQYSGWDHERYVVIELKEKRVRAVVSAWGGGC